MYVFFLKLYKGGQAPLVTPPKCPELVTHVNYYFQRHWHPQLRFGCQLPHFEASYLIYNSFLTAFFFIFSMSVFVFHFLLRTKNKTKLSIAWSMKCFCLSDLNSFSSASPQKICEIWLCQTWFLKKIWKQPHAIFFFKYVFFFFFLFQRQNKQNRRFFEQRNEFCVAN